MPVTIDFVPAARLHPPGHEWNVLKLKNGIYPFEPFWQDSLRNLKPFYTREKSHPKIGPIEFPKIYRRTYKININELLKHAVSTGEEIPPLFQNPFIKDVTPEYFKTFEIESSVLKPVTKLQYAYSCVLGSGQTWVPVDFGKIKSNKVTFRALGSESVYLPAYYKLGAITPAAYPILLNSNGKYLVLRPDSSRLRTISIPHVAFPRPDEKQYKQAFIGAAIEGSNNKDFKQPEILYSFDKLYQPGTHRITIKSEKKYRYIRLSLPNKNTKLNELRFFSRINGSQKEVEGKLIHSYHRDSLLFKKAVDKDLLTIADFTLLAESPELTAKAGQASSRQVWLSYDFKRPIAINAFDFYFVLPSSLRKEGIYELLYWDFGWKSLGIKKTYSTKPISYTHVPENALLMIKIHDTKNYSRIFTYENGEQHWY